MLLELYRCILKGLFRKFWAYSGTFSNIQPCSGILKNCVTLADTSLPYSEPLLI